MNQKKFLLRPLLLLLLACLVGSCSSPDKDKEKYYQNALKLIKEDKVEAAILELRSAIQLDAKYGEARYQLGLLYMQTMEPQKAFAEMVRAADLSPDNFDASLKVAGMHVLSGNKGEARKRINHILQKDPNHREALSFLANLETMDGKFTEALAILDKLGKEADTSDGLQNLKGRIMAGQEKWPEAEAAFQRAIALNSSNFANHKTLLLLYESRREKDKAKKLMDEIVAKFPENAEAHLVIAGYQRSLGNNEQVEKELHKVIELEPTNPRFRLQLADFYQQAGKAAEAEQILSKAHADMGKDADIATALATFYFEKKKFTEAEKLLTALKENSPGHAGTQLLAARFLFKEDKVRDGITILKKLTSDFPQRPEPFFHLAMAHYRLGEIDLAQQAIDSAIQKNGQNSEYHTFLAQLFSAKGAFEEAKKEAVIALRLNRKNLRAAVLLSQAFINTKQYDQALTILADMNKRIPGNVEILGNLAIATFGVGERQKGETILGELLELDPGNPQAVALFVGLKHKDNPAGAESFVRRQIAKVPEDPRLQLLLGGFLERQRKDQEALAAFEKAIELAPETAQPYLSAAKMLIKLGKKDEALKKYRAMVEKHPNSLPGRMGIAALLEVAGDTAEAMAEYQKILTIKEGFAPAANNLAWLVASDPAGDLGKALMLAMAAKQASPDDPNIADTLGWVHYKRGAHSLAQAQFGLALQRRPNDPELTYHLALAQLGDNKKKEAQDTLEELLGRKVDFGSRQKAEELLEQLRKQ